MWTPWGPRTRPLSRDLVWIWQSHLHCFIQDSQCVCASVGVCVCVWWEEEGLVVCTSSYIVLYQGKQGRRKLPLETSELWNTLEKIFELNCDEDPLKCNSPFLCCGKSTIFKIHVYLCLYIHNSRNNPLLYFESVASSPLSIVSWLNQQAGMQPGGSSATCPGKSCLFHYLQHSIVYLINAVNVWKLFPGFCRCERKLIQVIHEITNILLFVCVFTDTPNKLSNTLPTIYNNISNCVNSVSVFNQALCFHLVSRLPDCNWHRVK